MRRRRMVDELQRLGVVGSLLALVAGVGLLGFAVVSTRPDWAPWWTGWLLSGLGAVVAVAGLAGLVVWVVREGTSIDAAADRLREAATTQQLLGSAVLAGQKLLGRLNAYPAEEGDAEAERFWKEQVQIWTDWADRLNYWRLPQLRANFANEADRDSSSYVGTSWQHHLQTWMLVRMKRLNEFILGAKDQQGDLGPEPTEDERKEPAWLEPPDPLAVRREKALLASAHVHDVPHDPKRDENNEQIALGAGELDPSVCHDCGRSLINDRGTERLLLCPKLHGIRSREMRPTLFDGAVECGQPDS